MNKKSLHVVRKDDGEWEVRGTGDGRNSSRHATQAGAIQAARIIAQNQGGEVVIHRRDGKIKSRDSHGTVLTPPREKVERTRRVGSGTAVGILSEIKKAIAGLPAEAQTAIRQWMNSKRQRKRPKPKSPPQWPDFQARRKAIFGDRILPDSQAVLDDVRADRF